MCPSSTRTGRCCSTRPCPQGWDTYRGYRAEWEGDPDTDPVATAQHAGASTTVHAIWNGATGVSDWRVLAGSDPSSLAPVAVAAWNGLDTTITIGGSPAVVQVVALDDRGRTIRSSTPTAAA